MKKVYALACIALLMGSGLLTACSSTHVEARTEARASERVEDRRD